MQIDFYSPKDQLLKLKGNVTKFLNLLHRTPTFNELVFHPSADVNHRRHRIHLRPVANQLRRFQLVKWHRVADAKERSNEAEYKPGEISDPCYTTIPRYDCKIRLYVGANFDK